MKIAILFPKDSEALFNEKSSRTFGGASVQLYNIGKELGKYEEIETFSYVIEETKIDFFEEKFFKFVKTFSEKDNLYVKLSKLRKKFLENEIEVVIQRGLTQQSPILSFFCKIWGIKYVFMFASDVEVEGKTQSFKKRCYFFKKLLKNSFRIIVQNEYQKSKIQKKYSEKTFLIRNGFSLKEEENLKVKKDILWVSRSDKWKNPEKFLELALEYPSENFVMICPYSVNMSVEEYEKLKKNSEKISNLKFIEFVRYDKIDNYFSKSKIFVNTSDYEGSPQTFVQATMNAVPIVSLNSDPNSILEKHGCGFCAKGDFELLKEKIGDMVDKNTYQWKSMSSKCIAYAKEKHSIEKNVSKLVEILK